MITRTTTTHIDRSDLFLRLFRLLVVFAFFGSSVVTAAQIKNDFEYSPFVRKQCATCHSLEENGAGGGPSLSRMVLSDNAMDFATDMWNHGPDMMKKADEMGITFPHLETKDVAGMVSFMTAYRYYKMGAKTKGDVAKGEIVWKGMKCSGCHTLDSTSARLGNDLAACKNMSPIDMAQAMWNHGPEMIAAMQEHGVKVPRFSGTDVVDLLAYIRLRTGMKDGEVYSQLGDPTIGAQVFRDKQCVACHPVSEGDSGLKLERSKEFMQGAPGVAALMWNHSVGMWSEIKKNGLTEPKFKNHEMADMLAYLYLNTYTETPGDPVLGKKLFELKKCLSCHKPGSDIRVSQGRAYTDLDFVTGLWNHLPEMNKQSQESAASFPVFGPGEMKDLIAYLQHSQTQSAKGSH